MPPMDWEEYVSEIASDIMKEQSPKRLGTICILLHINTIMFSEHLTLFPFKLASFIKFDLRTLLFLLNNFPKIFMNPSDASIWRYSSTYGTPGWKVSYPPKETRVRKQRV